MFDGTDEPKLQRVSVPSIGETFPQIKVKTTQGMIDLPGHFSGKWFLFFTHPADFTPVCTTEFASMALNHESFRELNCELIGLSVDSYFSHVKWVEWIKEHLNVEIDFPIIADSYGTVAELFGAIHPAAGDGAIRAVYVIDPKAKIRSITLYPKGVGRNVQELIRTVQALQVADEHNVVIPANWPKNEFIRDHVLVRPPGDIKKAMEVKDRIKGSEECYDWWFCHRKV